MPLPNFETVDCKEGCVTCRHFYVYKFSFNPNYDAIQFDAHFTSCELCKKWVLNWNTENRKTETYEGINLWREEK